jgi:hypothetical protein
MKAVDAASKSEIEMMQSILSKKHGQLYVDIWDESFPLSIFAIELIGKSQSFCIKI